MSREPIRRSATRYLKKARTTVSTVRPGSNIWNWVKNPRNLNLMPGENPRGKICKCRAPLTVYTTKGYSDGASYECVCEKCGAGWPSYFEG